MSHIAGKKEIRRNNFNTADYYCQRVISQHKSTTPITKWA